MSYWSNNSEALERKIDEFLEYYGKDWQKDCKDCVTAIDGLRYYFPYTWDKHLAEIEQAYWEQWVE